jgi:hypothetical protein
LAQQPNAAIAAEDDGSPVFAVDRGADRSFAVGKPGE